MSKNDKRILIIGPPNSGKTTLAAKLGGGRSTDEAMSLGWSEGSAEAAQWLNEPGPWIIEGVALPRALRKWRDSHPGKQPPVDKIIYLTKIYIPHNTGQASMATGMETVMKEIRLWLSGVPSVTNPAYRNLHEDLEFNDSFGE